MILTIAHMESRLTPARAAGLIPVLGVNVGASYWGMSTADQTLSSALHGEALLAARRPEFDPLLIISLSKLKAAMISGSSALG